MRSIDEDDRAEIAKLNAEPWMLEYLKLNQGYVHWGPGDDYMSTKGESWSSSQVISGWSTFGPWHLDELNECVNFYFEVERDSKECAACGRSGYNPSTREISETFYDHGDYSIDFEHMEIVGDLAAARRQGGATGRRWCDKITQDEVDALVTAGRLRHWDRNSGWISVPRTAAEVNEVNSYGRPLGKLRHSEHDGINRYILIETRARRLGVYGLCDACHGAGYVYTEPTAHLNVVLWMIHPRKGASRGVRVERLSKADASAAVAWLREAAKRNAGRFAKIAEL